MPSLKKGGNGSAKADCLKKKEGETLARSPKASTSCRGPRILLRTGNIAEIAGGQTLLHGLWILAINDSFDSIRDCIFLGDIRLAARKNDAELIRVLRPKDSQEANMNKKTKTLAACAALLAGLSGGSMSAMAQGSGGGAGGAGVGAPNQPAAGSMGLQGQNASTPGMGGANSMNGSMNSGATGMASAGTRASMTHKPIKNNGMPVKPTSTGAGMDKTPVMSPAGGNAEMNGESK